MKCSRESEILHENQKIMNSFVSHHELICVVSRFPCYISFHYGCIKLDVPNTLNTDTMNTDIMSTDTMNTDTMNTDICPNHALCLNKNKNCRKMSHQPDSLVSNT